MDLQDDSLQTKKKVITLFGKKINVVANPSPPLDLTDSPPPPMVIATSPSPPHEDSSSTDSVQVLKLRLHLLEQKVKQLSESNEKMAAQLTAEIRRCEDLEIERDQLHSQLMKERERLHECEKENDVLHYKLDLVEKMYADTKHPHHSHSPYSPPPPRAWDPMDDMYPHESARYSPPPYAHDRRRSYDRYEDRSPIEYDERDIERNPLMYAPDYRPYDMQLPSPPPRTSVFNRLGASSTDLPNLPSSPSPLHEEFVARAPPTNRDREKEREQERASLEKRLDLPLDVLAKNSKMEKKTIPKSQKRPLCNFYLEKGTCKNGGACKFSHALSNKRVKV
eukprot:Phypoly_transcript_12640.p1 GENE.Phypoly_transcript_12640~~Phypoly_transcript_12640.p1  ORF type:complete len:336 (+),score=82.15 Phypoly_transcript_12640:75-1082(+)